MTIQCIILNVIIVIALFAFLSIKLKEDVHRLRKRVEVIDHKMMELTNAYVGPESKSIREVPTDLAEDIDNGPLN